MEKLNWEAIGAIAGLLGVVVAVFSIIKKDKQTDSRITQSIKGLFFSKNNISQNVGRKDEDD